MKDEEFFTPDDDEGDRFSPEALVRRAKDAGLIQGPDKLARIDAPGDLAAQLVSMKSRWVDVTPAMAEEWLKNNVCNRPLRMDVVKAYARQMKRGEWLPIPQGIAFDTNHALLNGQHRLHAVVMSGRAVRMMVTTGVPAQISGSEVRPMDLMDTGLTRSLADQLKIQHGLSGGSVLAAIVRTIVNLCVPERTRRLSVSEVLAVYRLFQAGIDHVMQHRSKAHGLKQAGVLAAFAVALTCDVRQAKQFVKLNTGDQVEPGSPLAVLREFLTSEQAILLTRGNDRALVEMVLHVLHQEILGRRITELKADGAGADYFRDRLPGPVAEVRKLFSLKEAAV
jgi:hypothetical protein